MRRWLIAAGAVLALPVQAARADLAHYVNPFNGTAEGQKDFGTGGGAGNTFPGPVRPFGMLQWSPDTDRGSKNPGGGYAYGDKKIRGFGVRRLSGAGCANGGDFPFLPTTAPVTASPAPQFSTRFSDAFEPAFSHAAEAAAPGYYRVTLDPGTAKAIGVQLTSGIRAGIARIGFPAGKTGTVLLNATGSRTGAAAGEVHIDAARRELSGAVTTGAFCMEPSRYRMFFVARFDRPFASVGTWRGQTLSPGSTSSADVSAANPLGLLDSNGPLGLLPTAVNTFAGLGFDGSMPTAQTGGYVTFAPKDRDVELRLGLSFVDVEGARRNLDREVDGHSFDAVRHATRKAWDRALGAIEVSGGKLADRRTFYSMLYHALVAPTTFSDSDGRYMGFDDEVHIAADRTQYADFSGWDVYRSQMPLLALMAPRVASDIGASLLADQRESGWLPKWSVANTHTEVMTGDPAAPTLAALWALGARGFDPREALAAMVKGATKTRPIGGYAERQGIAAYQALGYVPDELNGDVLLSGIDAWRRSMLSPLPGLADLVWGSAGTTLEYATADFAVARMAAAVGDKATCATFMKRSGYWRNVFDPSTGYVRPRRLDGSWVTPFDPNYNDTLSGKGFPEGDAAQYTWMVPHDPAGLFAALGGRDKALARLDRFFTQLNTGFSSPYAFLGNEPNSNAPWLYDWLGQPYKTQDIMRRAMLAMFDSSPGGYPGNDDLGQMSAWYVFGALGIYPAIPGSDVLALGSPLFPKATVRLRRGRLTITGRGASRSAKYVRSLRLGGHTWPKPWLRLSDVARGGRLDFRLSKDPQPAFGATAAPPPSYSPDDGSCSASRSIAF